MNVSQPLQGVYENVHACLLDLRQGKQVALDSKFTIIVPEEQKAALVDLISFIPKAYVDQKTLPHQTGSSGESLEQIVLKIFWAFKLIGLQKQDKQAINLCERLITVFQKIDALLLSGTDLQKQQLDTPFYTVLKTISFVLVWIFRDWPKCQRDLQTTQKHDKALEAQAAALVGARKGNCNLLPPASVTFNYKGMEDSRPSSALKVAFPTDASILSTEAAAARYCLMMPEGLPLDVLAMSTVPETFEAFQFWLLFYKPISKSINIDVVLGERCTRPMTKEFFVTTTNFSDKEVEELDKYREYPNEEVRELAKLLILHWERHTFVTRTSKEIKQANSKLSISKERVARDGMSLIPLDDDTQFSILRGIACNILPELGSVLSRCRSDNLEALKYAHREKTAPLASTSYLEQKDRDYQAIDTQKEMLGTLYDLLWKVGNKACDKHQSGGVSRTQLMQCLHRPEVLFPFLEEKNPSEKPRIPASVQWQPEKKVKVHHPAKMRAKNKERQLSSTSSHGSGQGMFTLPSAASPTKSGKKEKAAETPLAAEITNSDGDRIGMAVKEVSRASQMKPTLPQLDPFTRICQKSCFPSGIKYDPRVLLWGSDPLEAVKHSKYPFSKAEDPGLRERRLIEDHTFPMQIDRLVGTSYSIEGKWMNGHGESKRLFLIPCQIEKPEEPIKQGAFQFCFDHKNICYHRCFKEKNIFRFLDEIVLKKHCDQLDLMLSDEHEDASSPSAEPQKNQDATIEVVKISVPEKHDPFTGLSFTKSDGTVIRIMKCNKKLGRSARSVNFSS